MQVVGGGSYRSRFGARAGREGKERGKGARGETEIGVSAVSNVIGLRGSIQYSRFAASCSSAIGRDHSAAALVNRQRWQEASGGRQRAVAGSGGWQRVGSGLAARVGSACWQPCLQVLECFLADILLVERHCSSYTSTCDTQHRVRHCENGRCSNTLQETIEEGARSMLHALSACARQELLLMCGMQARVGNFSTTVGELRLGHLDVFHPVLGRCQLLGQREFPSAAVRATREPYGRGRCRWRWRWRWRPAGLLSHHIRAGRPCLFHNGLSRSRSDARVRPWVRPAPAVQCP